MAHDASGDIDGDVLLNWLLAPGFDCCGPGRCWSRSVRVRSCGEESVEKGSGLGGGQGRWGGVGVGGWHCHGERI